VPSFCLVAARSPEGEGSGALLFVILRISRRLQTLCRALFLGCLRNVAKIDQAHQKGDEAVFERVSS
jgi:hypothetical protein